MRLFVTGASGWEPVRAQGRTADRARHFRRGRGGISRRPERTDHASRPRGHRSPGGADTTELRRSAGARDRTRMARRCSRHLGRRVRHGWTRRQHRRRGTPDQRIVANPLRERSPDRARVRALGEPGRAPAAVAAPAESILPALSCSSPRPSHPSPASSRGRNEAGVAPSSSPLSGSVSRSIGEFHPASSSEPPAARSGPAHGRRSTHRGTRPPWRDHRRLHRRDRRGSTGGKHRHPRRRRRGGRGSNPCAPTRPREVTCTHRTRAR